MSYSRDSIQDYVDSFEQAFSRLEAMGSKVKDNLEVALLLASLGDRMYSQFGPVIASLQTRAGMLNWNTVTSVLI